ncbi:MAG: glycosyltransferase family 4 protein, partial [Candidatus Beckwithbacteria bacterium]|nr:glycosyltransferase family 4 protein [Candidatus Beckwithbacteria bacterium]
ETIVDSKTGVFFEDYSVKSLWRAMKHLNNLNYLSIRKNCFEQAKKFSKERFKREIKAFVAGKVK